MKKSATDPATNEPLPEVLKEGRDYVLENGLFVLTADYLARRGHCCGSRCRNCPYEPRHGGAGAVLNPHKMRGQKQG